MVIDKKTVLGIGGYGTVFKGEWNSKKVAVKRIELAKWENAKGEEALQKLDHPNVVQLYHVASDVDFRYYALELCQLSLSQLFNGDEAQKNYCEKMPPEKEVCLQLAKGLAHIHEKGLIHRDIKPENVLIQVDSWQEKMVMKWADFGLSKKVSESHSISGMRGTNNWHSPEIVKIMRKGNDGKTTTTKPSIPQRGTVKSDVFSEGLVFGYYLLGGDHPFGSDSINVLQNIVNNEPVNLTKIKEHPLYAIIMDMLKDNPKERISSTDVVSRIKKEEYIEDSIAVWHGPHCRNCIALKSIDEKNFARLQHHFKYCSIYCVFYQVMADLEKRVQSNENIKDKYKKELHIFQSKQAQHLCELSAENPQEFSSTNSELLFEMAAKLSEELLGPAETATFDCDRYEEYLRLLLEIAWVIKADIELIGDIEMYLKPFDRNAIEKRSKPYAKWDETFFDLKHSPEDENFGSDLKDIAEPELSENSFLIPTEYKAKCHGII